MRALRRSGCWMHEVARHLLRSGDSGSREATAAAAVRLPRLGSTRRSSLLRHQHAVDHVDHAIGLADIGNADSRLATLGIDDPQLAVMQRDGERLTFNGLQHGLAAVLPGIGHQLRGTVIARYHEVGQELRQLRLVFRLYQRIDRACGQLAEGCIARLP
ncbi:hypothetical protein G6F68_016097 [Rhizopus microsporus]|nr:hypothetical protein G6F68_016097 [Rhizopus microsporus]